MKITLTKQESESHFYNALCNGASYISGYGIDIQAKTSDYIAAKAKLQKTPIEHLQDAINETDDATTADVILQTVFYGEVIFG